MPSRNTHEMAAATMESLFTRNQPIRILFVEDEFLISEWVTEALTELGFAVEAVSNATDALRCLASAPVDLLFTDINLPGAMDGAALARRARELRPDLPVVYASARMSMADPDTRVPDSIFVPKPYAPALVGRLLAHAVSSAEARVP
jgi:CheY-like chemotaxis protein